MQHLRGTVFQSLLLSSTSSLESRAYFDIDYGSDPTDGKFVIDFCMFFSDSLISCKSKKPSIVSLSSTKTKYRVMASTTKEIVWLHSLLADMGEFLSHPTPMYYDHRIAIEISHNSIFHEQTKHIEIDCHLTCHHLKQGTITFPFVSFSLQLADLYTKSHSIFCFCFLVDKLSMLVTTTS